MRKFFVVIILLCTGVTSQAQHLNSWLRATLIYRIDKQWSVDAEGQDRRQNALHTMNPFKESLLYSFRTWIHYRPDKTWAFSLSPFAWYSAYRIIETNSDYNSQPSQECRISATADFRRPIKAKLSLVSREALEYRMFVNNNKSLRLRNKVGLYYEFTTSFYTQATYEILLNVSACSNAYLFDHDRISLSTVYNAGSHCTIEIGYMYINRLPLIAEKRITENNLFLNLGYKIKS